MTPADTETSRLATDDAHRMTNPVFGNRKVKLGAFCFNLSYASTISTMDGVFPLSWENSRHVADLAESMDFEAVVPVGRWRGFGGETDFNGEGFESFTFASAMGVATTKPAVFATSHVPTIHPIMAAKQATTIDHISGGRFALNLVTGWHKTEIEMFGTPMREHDDRYDAAAEWLTIIKMLWQRDEPFTFEGDYYQVRDALIKPAPLQKPHPAVMCAGQSTKGQHFAAKHCDITFTSTTDRGSIEELQAAIAKPRKLAYEEYGRDLKVWCHIYVIVGDTERDAQRQLEHCIENADTVALDNALSTLGLHSRSFSADDLQRIRQDFIAGFSGIPVIGTKEQVAEKLIRLADAGMDGSLVSWPAYISGMERFKDEVHPLLVQAGAR